LGEWNPSRDRNITGEVGAGRGHETAARNAITVSARPLTCGMIMGRPVRAVMRCEFLRRDRVTGR
jgi:hypothetical protein